MNFYINDHCELVDTIVQQVRKNPNKEHYAVAVAKVEKAYYIQCTMLGYRNLKAVDGKPDSLRAVVSPELTKEFLRACILDDYTPVIIHTHPRNENDRVRFSLQDIRFMEKFSQEAKKMERKYCLYIITDGVQVIYALRILSHMITIYEEKIYDQ